MARGGPIDDVRVRSHTPIGPLIQPMALLGAETNQVCLTRNALSKPGLQATPVQGQFVAGSQQKPRREWSPPQVISRARLTYDLDEQKGIYLLS